MNKSMMEYKDTLSPCQYSVKVLMSPPQVIDKTKSFYHLDRRFSKSPKRGTQTESKKKRTMQFIETKPTTFNLNHELDAIITEKLKTTKSFEEFIYETEIEKLIKKD